VLPPALDKHLRLDQCVEYLRVQQFVEQLPDYKSGAQPGEAGEEERACRCGNRI
jgi:hypothetical protein